MYGKQFVSNVHQAQMSSTFVRSALESVHIVLILVAALIFVHLAHTDSKTDPTDV